jgi:hypothetical protein
MHHVVCMTYYLMEPLNKLIIISYNHEKILPCTLTSILFNATDAVSTANTGLPALSFADIPTLPPESDAVTSAVPDPLLAHTHPY